MKTGTNLTVDWGEHSARYFPLLLCEKFRILPKVSADQDNLHWKSVYRKRLLSEVCLFNKSMRALKSGGDFYHRLILEGFVSNVGTCDP